MKKKKIKTKTTILKFIHFNNKHIPLLKKAAVSALKSENINSYQINFIMISDIQIKKLNAKYRNVKRITDVISFLIIPQNFTGDIYIACNRSKKQAKQYEHLWIEELAYLTIHGILHLCGYSDYETQNKKIMFEKQDKIFKCLFS
ncbi:MAG: rRNA maturation RNase YbeY [Elusimicrobiota bacterium]|jgi:probable rRNA maturation factor|nr:rRNA maturation RNase YbeY [Elusimicrobiota bacterium]